MAVMAVITSFRDWFEVFFEYLLSSDVEIRGISLILC